MSPVKISGASWYNAAVATTSGRSAAPVPVQCLAIKHSVCASSAVSAVCSLNVSGRPLRIRLHRVMYFMRPSRALSG